MLYINKYILRNKRKQIPLLMIVTVFTFLILTSYNYLTLLERQKMQLFEQYKDFTNIVLDSTISLVELNQLKKELDCGQCYDITLLYFPTKLLFGQDVIETYGVSKLEWEKIKSHYDIKYQTVDYSEPYAVLSTDLNDALRERKFPYKNLKLPVIGEIDTQGKFGFLIGIKEGIPGLMVFDAFSSEQVQLTQFKHLFINDIVSYEAKLKKNQDELLFINIIYKMIISITILTSCFILGVSTYLSMTKRKGEIAISQVMNITQKKIIFKFFVELISVFSLGIISGLLTAYLVWNIIFTPYLAKMSTQISFTLPSVYLIIIYCSIIPSLVIILKTVRSGDPVEVILKNQYKT